MKAAPTKRPTAYSTEANAEVAKALGPKVLRWLRDNTCTVTDVEGTFVRCSADPATVMNWRGLWIILATARTQNLSKSSTR